MGSFSLSKSELQRYKGIKFLQTFLLLTFAALCRFKIFISKSLTGIIIAGLSNFMPL